MKILRIEISNIKRLRHVTIVPTGAVIKIAGKNEQGKTTILESIPWAFLGARVIQEEPIRQGENKGSIKLELGTDRVVELIVERTFTRKGSEEKTDLKFTNADRSPQKLSPQEMADLIIGEGTIDPGKFGRLKPREQFDELRKIAKIEVDIEALDAANAADYERRGEINKEAKRNRAAAELIPFSAPMVLVDTEKINQQIGDAGRVNQKNAERREKRRAFEKKTEEAEAEAADLRMKAANLRNQASVLETRSAEADNVAAEGRATLAGADPVPEVVDVRELLAQLSEANQANREAEKSKADDERRRHLEQKAAELEDESRGLTTDMEDRATQKQVAIAAAVLPVPGLGFGDGFVTYLGMPLKQASKAQRTRVGCAISMSSDPEPQLKVVCIEDASLLDSESRAIVREMAEKRGYQVLMEIVEDLPMSGFVIEDGGVVPEEEMERRREEARNG